MSFSEVQMSSSVISFMVNTCLAQAQECVLEQSLTGNRKPIINGELLIVIGVVAKMWLGDFKQGGYQPVISLAKKIGSQGAERVSFVKKICSLNQISALSAQSNHPEAD
jgi:BRO1-like domain.